MRWTTLVICLMPINNYCRGNDTPLEDAIRQVAPDILRWAEDNGCRNIGVLKFLVRRGQDAPTMDSGGTLNMSMANRLETALILALDEERAERTRLVRRASSVAATIPGATPLTLEGRRRLFDAEYRVAWGRTQTPVDALITGVVTVTPDFRSLFVEFVVVRTGNPGIQSISRPLIVATNGSILNELGESYQLRNLGPGMTAADAVRDVRAEPELRFPLLDEPNVMLQVLYDGKPVDMTFIDGQASIPEPSEGQSVKLRIERLDRSRGALAAVLKVNGENVLFREKFPDLDCSKYVLEPNSPAITVDGYQMELDQAEAFRVLGIAESRAVEIFYGEDVGTISLTIFREAEDTEEEASGQLAPDLAAIGQGYSPVEPAKTLPALQQELRSFALGGATRGLMVPGQKIDHQIRLQEKRKWHPEPVMSAVLRYYRPKNAP